MKHVLTVIAFLIFSLTGMSQNVGVGTTTPPAKFTVVGASSNPSIPNNTSTGIFRIAIGNSEGIDFGKMSSGSVAGWIQSGYAGVDADPLSLQPMGGKVGIGTVNPTNLLSISGSVDISGNLGIGTTTPNASARLDVSSTTQGVLLPRMTTAQKNAIINPAEGLEVYDLTLHQKSYYNGTAWVSQANPPIVADALPTIQIGTQKWMNKNLDVAFYSNGDPIPQVTDANAWAGLTTGAWCYYNNDPIQGGKFGKLYNWYAVNDPRGLAPQGWHIPSDAEWTTLATTLGGSSVAGGKMKEAGIVNWPTPNTAADNSSGWAGLPGGNRNDVGTFGAIGVNGGWWSSTEVAGSAAWYRYLNYWNGSVNIDGSFKRGGFSVRCLRD